MDKWTKFFRDIGIKPIFFALPTNPEMIAMHNNIENYKLISEAFKVWAKSRKVDLIDLSLKIDYDRLQDFSDHRHLSERGAYKFTRELAKAVSEQF